MELNGYDRGTAIQYSLLDYGASYSLSEHFKLGEFACRDGSSIVLVHPALVRAVQLLRDNLGPLHISSAYRTPGHNASIGGVQNSYHLDGMAADIVSRLHPPHRVATLAREIGLGGVGLYPSFVHIDVGPVRTW